MHAGSSGSHRQTWRDWLRSARAGMDPDGFMRQCAGDPGPFTLIFPGMGPVHFVASVDAAREILTTPREALCAPTPNPIEPIVGPESVILTSGAVHRRQRTLLSPAFHGAQMRDGPKAWQARSSTRSVHGGPATSRAAHHSPIHHTADHHSSGSRRRGGTSLRGVRGRGKRADERQHRAADAVTDPAQELRGPGTLDTIGPTAVTVRQPAVGSDPN